METKTEKTVYLDCPAAGAVSPEVLEEMLPYLWEAYGNPRSLHSWGDEAGEVRL